MRFDKGKRRPAARCAAGLAVVVLTLGGMLSGGCGQAESAPGEKTGSPEQQKETGPEEAKSGREVRQRKQSRRRTVCPGGSLRWQRESRGRLQRRRCAAYRWCGMGKHVLQSPMSRGLIRILMIVGRFQCLTSLWQWWIRKPCMRISGYWRIWS